jgi:phosphatidylethanolamine-binding protein (PEBP) family uncharacterized protein
MAIKKRTTRRRCHIRRGGNLATLVVRYGNTVVSSGSGTTGASPKFLTKGRTAEAPIVEVNRVTGPYTLVMYDPDAPASKPNSYLHWIQSPIGDIEYIGPSPPAGSGDHRYIFEIYEGAPIGLVEDRSQFSLDKIGFGDKMPIAAATFKVKATA